MIRLQFNRDDFDEFMVMANTHNLLEDEPREFLVDLAKKQIYHKVLDMKDGDVLTLELDTHPAWLRMMVWIQLAKPRWIISF